MPNESDSDRCWALKSLFLEMCAVSRSAQLRPAPDVDLFLFGKLKATLILQCSKLSAKDDEQSNRKLIVEIGGNWDPKTQERTP